MTPSHEALIKEAEYCAHWLDKVQDRIVAKRTVKVIRTLIAALRENGPSETERAVLEVAKAYADASYRGVSRIPYASRLRSAAIAAYKGENHE